MFHSDYCLVFACLSVVLAMALWYMYRFHKDVVDKMQDKYDALSTIEKNESLKLEKLLEIKDRLCKDIRDRREFMYWAARELNEHDDAASRNEIIHKMIDLTYYEKLTEVPLKEGVPINQMCRELIEEAKQKVMSGIDVKYQSNFNDFYAPHTNRECFEKVLRNLLDNAARYTTDGCIVLDVTEEVGRLSVSVTDTGSGISSDRRQSLFSLLKNIGHFKHRVSTGLNLCRTLVEFLGGSLYVDPHYRKGTRVIFDIAI